MTLTERADAPAGASPPTTDPPDRTPSGADRLRATILGRGPLLALSAVSAVLGALSGLVPYVVVYLLAVELFAEGEPRPERITALALVAAGGLVAKVLFQALANYVSHVCAYGILAELRTSLAARFSRMPLGRVGARSGGEVKKVLQDDVEQMELGLSHAIPDIAAALAVPVASLVVMFVMDWRMALAALAVVVLVPLCVAWAGKRTAGVAARESEAKADLNTSVVSYLQGIRVVRGFLRDGAAFTGVDRAVREAEAVENAKMGRGKLQAVLASALVSGSVLFLLPLGTYLVSTGSLDVPTLVFFLLIGVGFAQPLMGLALSMAVLQYQIESGARNIAAILDEPDLPVPETPLTPEGHTLELDSVCFSYGAEGAAGEAAREDRDGAVSGTSNGGAAGHESAPGADGETVGAGGADGTPGGGGRGEPVLTGIDLTVPENTSLALVGATGAGKSTLVRLLARFHDVTEGSVRLGGVDLRDMDPADLMRTVAFVQQDDYIFDDTVLENIRLARPDATDEEVVEAGTRARVAEFVDELEEGWHTRLRAGGGRLSGGQRQRVSVARALLKDARVVLLDEATAFLDPENEVAVAEALAELGRDRTLVTVAHRLGSIVDYDRIVLLDQGRVAASGTHGQLLAQSPTYARMWSDYQTTQGWELASAGPADGADGATGGAVDGAVDADVNGAVESASDGAPADGSPALTPTGAPTSGTPTGAPDEDRDRAREREEDTAERTEPVAGLTGLAAVPQWFALLGRHRRDFWRVGFWRILLEGFLTSAPVIVVFFALLSAIAGDITPADAVGYGVVLLALFAARVATGVSIASRWWPRALSAGSDLRRSVLQRLREVPLGFFGRTDTGRLSTVVVSDLSLVDFINMPMKATAALIQPVLAVVVLSLLDWRLAAAALLGVPVFLCLLWLSDRSQHAAIGAVTESRARADADLLEFVRGTSVLRAHPDAPQARRYREAVEDLRRDSVRMAVRTTPLTSAATVALELGFVALVVVGSGLYLGGSVGVATLLVFLVISLNLYRPYQELVELSSYRHMQQKVASRIGQVWDAPVLSRPADPQKPRDASVELRGVRFDYDGADGQGPVLDGVSFRAEPGTVTALVGPSGAGKSTVANLVARFWDVDEGSVLVGGQDVRSIEPRDLMAAVTTVYQEVYLFPDTVRANLTIGAPEATDAQLRAALEAAQAWGFVSDLPEGLDTVLGEGGQDLSGGQRQRLSIARALLKDSPVLLLDEAVASVDPSTEVRIQRAISELAVGRTVVVVAHRLNTVRSADRIVVLDGDGSVDGVGTHEQLLSASPVYQRLWEANERAAHLRG